MFQGIETQFLHYVLPSFQDYIKASNSQTFGTNNEKKAALDCASRLYHLWEFLPSSLSSSLTRSDIENQCPDYRILGDIANASKHNVLNQGNRQRLVTAESQVHECLVETHYRDAFGPYCHREIQVLVETTTGTSRNIKEILINVMKYWYLYLQAQGATNYQIDIPNYQESFPKSRGQAAQSKITGEHLRGVAMSLYFKFQKYNALRNMVEPILPGNVSAFMPASSAPTGSHLEFRAKDTDI